MFVTEATSVREQPRLLIWPRIALSSLHYWITAALAALLLPLGAMTRLAFEPPIHLLALFAKVSVIAIVFAALFHVVDTPMGATLASFRTRPARLVIPAVMAGVFVSLLGWTVGLLLAAVAFVVLEFLYRNPTGRLSTVKSFLLPAVYLATGIVLICYYSEISASVRYFGTYDPLFMRLDSWLGIDVPALSKQAAALSPRILVWAEEVYFVMFYILGASLILVALEGGLNRALQFVGAVLLAYYISFAIYLMLPSLGPFVLCLDHSSTFPNTLSSYSIEMSLLARAKELYHHTSTMAAPGGYFISFPCMHVVKPTVALWYLRNHRNIALLLLGYVIVLVPAIVVLEWHYVVDIPVGFAIAALVSYISDRPARIVRRASAEAVAC